MRVSTHFHERLARRMVLPSGSYRNEVSTILAPLTPY